MIYVINIFIISLNIIQYIDNIYILGTDKIPPWNLIIFFFHSNNSCVLCSIIVSVELVVILAVFIGLIITFQNRRCSCFCERRTKTKIKWHILLEEIIPNYFHISLNKFHSVNIFAVLQSFFMILGVFEVEANDRKYKNFMSTSWKVIQVDFISN